MTVLKSYLESTKTVTEEYQKVRLDTISGSIPQELQGTLFRNGNGNHQHMGTPYDHVFDGDGMINKFEIKKDGIVYSNAYVKTREFQEEVSAGKMLYRSFGTNLPGGWLKNIGKLSFKNAANTNVIQFGGKTLALWEGGWPHEIDPETLQTKGRYHYDGVLINNFSFIDKKVQPELPFSAHPKLLTDQNILYNFGTSPGGVPRLILYKLNAAGQATIEQVIKLKRLSFTHDFVITASGKKIFFLTPVAFNIWKTLAGTKSPVESLDFRQDKNTKILIVDNGEKHYLESDFCFIFHFLNTYEEADGTIVVDALKMANFPDADNNKEMLQGNDQVVLHATPTRYYLDLKRNQVKQETLANIGMELPAVHPDLRGKDYQFAYGIAYTKDKPHT
ncbi:MAG: carotenoid oxygenase family protein, partial [Bacteroidota bacterium]